MNKESITARLRNKSKKTGVQFNTLLSQFFFDEFLKKMSESEYSDHFTLKGGILMSSVLGLSNRATKDIDFLLNGFSMEKQSLTEVIDRIIGQHDQENVWFERDDEGEPIRDEDEYGGYRFHLTGHLANIRVRFGIDIATGDPVTPAAEKIDYMMVTDEVIRIRAYPLETVLAEKVQTILNRAEANGRSKDFYDVYEIWKMKSNELQTENLKQAFARTFTYRNTVMNEASALGILEKIENDEACRIRWGSYRNKNLYVGQLELSDVLKSCREIIKIIN
ncbi:MAG: nucleotidyl transferase AbiEii/AbiGii toxin family protein [Lachnospiraceae bacterium]|jgi:predicted nucleotidyltransferase component of viral defense system|nr:nucleotidyl transferase AbiEii/AbiGii toxin family protein [Lachnospiraceae bacterium]MCI1726899.1 nucleotidyl transferase AbiEii/AbiGii toxin family protein [Lachnospiraceae bacterium]